MMHNNQLSQNLKTYEEVWSKFFNERDMDVINSEYFTEDVTVVLPGDDIVGFITISNGIAVHVSDCLNVQINPKKGERIVDVSWSLSNITGIIVWIEIEAIDRPYLLRDATIAISDNGGNILIARSTTNSKRIVTLIFQVEISDGSQVDKIINDSKLIDNVFDAKRIFPGENV